MQASASVFANHDTVFDVTFFMGFPLFLIEDNLKFEHTETGSKPA